MPRADFCAFILSHGRPAKVKTYKALRKAGYTGKIWILIDDEDSSEDEYRRRYGDEVIQFCKSEIADRTDEGDNFLHRHSTIYARNVMHDIARKLGYKFFIQLDDDYTGFEYRFESCGKAGYIGMKTTFDEMIDAMLEFYAVTPCLSIAMAQGGDYIGGCGDRARGRLTRKAMNSFICSVERPFQFIGHLNEDVNTYCLLGHKGELFFTVMPVKLVQTTTQASAEGMSTIYIKQGTYVKTFYSVMYAPSCVKVYILGDPRGNAYRIHHAVAWNNCVPKILAESHKKQSPMEAKCHYYRSE